ncbi:hypothetical protein LWM68_41435 [Niabella sp. W65]|nr:hypothetical protein [Niabella sp. W65]MCH7368633.1 hypothetical protein [Niabella sp. W65]ULT44216.1 hypothetical protein KRR40_13150 [Niabella sp. I65]
MLLAKFICWGCLYWLIPYLPAQTYQTTIMDGSSFTLKGSSNINKFELVYTGTLGKTNNVQVEKEETRITMKSGSGVNLKVDDFKALTLILRKTLEKCCGRIHILTWLLNR